MDNVLFTCTFTKHIFILLYELKYVATLKIVELIKTLLAYEHKVGVWVVQIKLMLIANNMKMY